MKIIFFGNDTERIAAIRYRVIKFARMLESEGHRCVICLPSSVRAYCRLYENQPRCSKLLYLALVALRRLAQLRHVPGADCVYFRGPIFPYGPPIFERIIRLLNPRLIFDIDDAIWEPPAYVTSPFVRFVDLDWVWKMCRLCKHAVVGNEYLAEHVRPHIQAVTIIPTCVDMERHTLKPPPADHGAGPVLLGWTGLKDNLGYLEIIEDVIQDLAKRHNIALTIATGKPYQLDGVRVINHTWELEHEIDYLQEPDIGLMPLVATERAKGKCAFKAISYMAVGTPVVISPVGMNAELIEDGANGFLASTPEEWRDKLERLIVDPHLRRRMGLAARETIERLYSHEANYPRLKAAIETVTGKPHP